VAYRARAGRRVCLRRPNSRTQPSVRNLALKARIVPPCTPCVAAPGRRPEFWVELRRRWADGRWFPCRELAIHLAAVVLISHSRRDPRFLAGVSRGARGSAIAIGGRVFCPASPGEPGSQLVLAASGVPCLGAVLWPLSCCCRGRTYREHPEALAFLGQRLRQRFLFGLGTKQIVVTMPLAYLLLAIAVPERSRAPPRVSWPKRLVVLAPSSSRAAGSRQLLVSARVIEGRGLGGSRHELVDTTSLRNGRYSSSTFGSCSGHRQCLGLALSLSRPPRCCTIPVGGWSGRPSAAARWCSSGGFAARAAQHDSRSARRSRGAAWLSRHRDGEQQVGQGHVTTICLVPVRTGMCRKRCPEKPTPRGARGNVRPRAAAESGQVQRRGKDSARWRDVADCLALQGMAGKTRPQSRDSRPARA